MIKRLTTRASKMIQNRQLCLSKRRLLKSPQQLRTRRNCMVILSALDTHGGSAPGSAGTAKEAALGLWPGPVPEAWLWLPLLQFFRVGPLGIHGRITHTLLNAYSNLSQTSYSYHLLNPLLNSLRHCLLINCSI